MKAKNSTKLNDKCLNNQGLHRIDSPMNDTCFYCDASVAPTEGQIKPGPDGQPIVVCGVCLAPGRRQPVVKHDENAGTLSEDFVDGQKAKIQS